MPITELNGIKLYYEITGDGFPLVFSHEFAGDYRSWEPQVRFFSRRYKVIVYNHRGYPPSELPTDPSAYSQDTSVEDLYQLLLYLNIPRAHMAGLSMGANVILNFGLKHPEVCASLAVAGCGTGSIDRGQFKKDAEAMIERLQREGMQGVIDLIALGPSRIRLRKKDLRGWQTFREQLLGHSALGSALTFAGVQLKRPTIFELEAGLKELQMPVLLLVGDEDEPCIEPTLFMKRHIPQAGLVTFPQSGHCVNLEEPELFNRVMLDFLTMVDAGKWN